MDTSTLSDFVARGKEKLSACLMQEAAKSLLPKEET